VRRKRGREETVFARMTEVKSLGCLRGLVCLMGQSLGPLDWGSPLKLITENKVGHTLTMVCKL